MKMNEAEPKDLMDGNRKVLNEEPAEGAKDGKYGEKDADLSSGNGSNAERIQTGKKEEGKPSKPSKLKEIWSSIGLDVGTLLMMFKGSIAPAITIAFYQADYVAHTFGSLGYLVPIVSVLCITIMPRAKYIQTLILNTIGICIGSAVSLLGIWSGVQARIHTAPLGDLGYNSSQSAVCAVWLFANIWLVNVFRAKLPALQFPAIMYSIFTNVAFTVGPVLPTVAAGESLIKLMLEAFFTAFAISTVVNLLVIPVSSRTVIFKEQTGYLSLIRGIVKAQVAYLSSLENSDMFSFGERNDQEIEDENKRSKNSKKDEKKSKSSGAQNPQAKALKAGITALTGLHGRLHGDMPFAKREMAYGKLSVKDIDEIFTLFRGILIPLIGMGTITDIFERIAERRGWLKTSNSSYDKSESWGHYEDAAKDEEKRTWNEIMKTLHEPFAVAAAAMDEAIEHAGIVLELLPRPKKKKGEDVEERGIDPRPGHPDFGKYLDQKMLEFHSNRGVTFKAWAREKGLSQKQFDSSQSPMEGNDSTQDEVQHRRDQQQLYLILYLEHLLYSTGLAISNLVKFADRKVEDGTMAKKRLILPGVKRLKKWIYSIGREDSSVDTESPDSMEAGNNNVYMGSGFNPKKDPEHLPAQNAWQKFGNGLRTIPRFLGSTESAFGFRVALATMTIGIVGFLRDTQAFFIEQRLVWALIIIAIGMTMTSGQSIFGFFGRVAGTTLAMVASIVIWYIVDQKTPGVIVMLWFFIFIEMYFFMKYPRFIGVWLVTIVTQVLIVGYELEVVKIGVKAASTSGQPYYPIYELAPYRLACVAGGSLVAFIWTVFPYSLSDRSWLRKDLGSTLYLLANYYSVVHSTIGARIHNVEGDMDSKHSPGRRLEKVRHQIFGKVVMLLPSLAQHADWQRWEITIGGKFPKETYDGIAHRATNIMNYLSLISYATQSWSTDNRSANPNAPAPEVSRNWIQDLSYQLDVVSPTSHQITSTLSLLSASVRQGTALPPYIQLPEAYNLSLKLEALDKGILDPKHVEEPGYSAYAVMQVASSLVTDDLARLADHVKDLVGETDFSFTVPGTSDASFGSGGVDGNGKGKSD